MDNKTSNGRLGTGGRNYFDVDGDDIPMAKAWPKEGSGQNGGQGSTDIQEYTGSHLKDEMRSTQDRVTDVGDMPLKPVGDMAPMKYGKDLGPKATNSLGTFDADSDGNGTDDMNDPMLQPRPGTSQFRM